MRHNNLFNLAALMALCFDGDAGAGGGTSGGAGGGTQNAGTQTATNANTNPATGTNGGAPPATNTDTVSRAEYAALAAKLAERDAADQKAKEKKAKEDGKFQELYDTTLTELEKVKPDVERAQKYATAILGQVTKMLEGVPDYVKTLIEKMEPLDQFNWLNENLDKIKTSAGAANGGASGNSNTSGSGGNSASGGSSGANGGNSGVRGGGTNPPPAGNLSREELIANERRALLASGDYGTRRA